MTITEIRNILENPYDRKVWKSFLQTQFTNNKLNAEDRPIILADKSITKKCLSLGSYEVNEFTKIGIFEIELNEKVNLSRNRVALRNLLKDISAQVAGAMVVFVQGEKWRFSYISKRKVKNAETNLIETKETAPKRYTYLFGKGEKALTAAQQFDKLIRKQRDNLYQFLNLNDFEEAFSVEKLGKDFFRNYKEIYEEFVEYITGTRYVKKTGKWTVSKAHDPHFDFHDIFKNDDKAVRDFFKRMLGRIVFLYFIEKKGWLAVEKGKNWDEGNPNYLYDLYKNAKYKELFYSDYLVPLFFETLNDPNSENEDRELRFPYLNGGLFDRTQDFQYDKLALPSSIFDKLFETFNNFNFTVYEDAPDEHTIAVDPEMLGHIFENLLEDNKDKGAFYTPKEIVHYMSKESLIAYLISKNKLEDEKHSVAKSALRKIINQQELNEAEEKYAKKQAFAIIDDLEKVRICDPAIGSGAFPMGLLQEIFNTRVFLMEMSGFTKNISDADIKKHIIEESIYGVDIDPGAVDIARLRFWLSLVVDEPKPQPLPNLSFKIVCANTLISLGKPKGNLGLTNEIADEIKKIREDYFDANKEAKNDLERQFRNAQNRLWTSSREWATGEDAEIYRKISEFNPFEDKSCSWFDPWWMFGVEDGFDIVIGNPPYVRRTSISANHKKEYEKNYKSAYKQYDLYILFIEMGLKILKKNGTLSFINPNKFFVAEYGLKIREIILTQSDILKIVDLSKCSVFENALTYPIVLLLKNNYTKINTSYIQLENLNEFENIESKFNLFKLYNYNSLFEIIFQSNPILSLIVDEIESVKANIGNYFKCNRGIPNNKVKFVDEGIRAIKSVNVQKYSIDKSNTFIEFIDKYYGIAAKELFSNELLLLPRTVLNLKVAYHNQQDIILDRIYYLQKIGNSINTKYVLSILNSKLIQFWFDYKFTSTKIQGGYFDLRGTQITQIPIKKMENQNSFTTLVDYILLQKRLQMDSTFFERLIDAMVYELYLPEIIKAGEAEILKYLDNLSELNTEDDNKNLKIVDKMQKELSDPKHPVSASLLKLLTIDEINLIEGRK